MRIVINGFGRIGRTILRQILTQPGHDDIDIVLINDIAPRETCAYLFKYDSTFGPLPCDVVADKTGLLVGDRLIPFSSSPFLSSAYFSSADVVLECTGQIKSRDVAERGLNAGARAVLISGPSEFADSTIVLGANDQTLGEARIVSNSSCTTNAIAPLLRAIDLKLGIERAHVTTIHCYTNSQPLVDAPRGSLARSRAGAESMVPTTTSAMKELLKVLPQVGKLTSVAAVRVPSLSVSAIDATLQLSSPVGPSINTFLESIVKRGGVIGATQDDCVSRDMRARVDSLILALPETQMVASKQLRVFGWYDNEWGFSARMIDMARRLAARTN
ncbi:type I glyceraldehyde-3-phosphate dehydrogenase [Sulfitobacter sp. SK011]|uniref:type I glyceraldehyde-3-phosphate dehydrogenase n=1 Tax=Sulfitobacter sp. SK011 TaxID=1389004 RepID=UPI000E0A7553|nr:glyceraldehyde 3-phosphate dehydrogenase NAD-binding domain-containing protein [Sulfitobacter sp. SK011]AXI44006.1 glyceraldehyde-3-phosphate dehydrogenase [Sulfitobacter sp. SK011]